MDEQMVDELIKKNYKDINNEIPPIVEDRINMTLASLPKKNKINVKFFKYAAGIAIICTVGIGIFVYHRGLNMNGNMNSGSRQAAGATVTGNRQQGMDYLPFPAPFKYPIVVKSNVNPVSSNHPFIIEPKDENWTGKKLKVYYIPESVDNQIILVYKKVLPSEAKLLGTTDINQGKWSFQCEIPKQKSGNERNGFYIAVQNDEGILSGTRVDCLNYDKFQVYPENPQVGQNIECVISGITKGYKAKFILHGFSSTAEQVIEKSDFMQEADGKISSSFTLSPDKVTPGQYKIEAEIVPSGWDYKDLSLAQNVYLDFVVK